MLRVGLFVATNIAVLLVASVVFKAFGLDDRMAGQGAWMDPTSMLVVAAIFRHLLLPDHRLLVDRVVFRTERGYGPGFWIVTILAQIVPGIPASLAGWVFRTHADGFLQEPRF